MNKDIQEKINNRQEANRELLKYLSDIIEGYPELRWGQILSNWFLPIGDPFFEESVDTLKRFEKISNSNILYNRKGS